MRMRNLKKSWALGLALSAAPLFIGANLAADTQSESSPVPSAVEGGGGAAVSGGGTEASTAQAQAAVKEAAPLSQKSQKPSITKVSTKSTPQNKGKAKVKANPVKPKPIDPKAIHRKPEIPGMLHTLPTTLESAYRNNTEIRELQAQVRASDEKVPQALAGWRPTVNLRANLVGSKEIDSGDFKDPIGTNPNPQTGVNASNVNASIELNQNLFNGGKTVAETCVAENTVQAARAGLTEKEREILLAGVKAYAAVIARRGALELRKNNEHTLKKTLEATQDKFNVGEETRTSIAQAEASLADAVAKRQTAEAAVMGAEATFMRVTGAPAGTLQKPSIPSNFPRSLKEAVAIAQKNHPAIRQALFQERADRSSIKANDADLLPKVDLQASVLRDGRSSFTKYPPGTTYTNKMMDLKTVQTVSVGLVVPIYEAGLTRAKSRELRETAEWRRIQIETKRRGVIEELAQAWESYLAAKASVKNYQEQIKAREVALEGTRQEVLVGSKILLDELNAQQQLVEAQQNLVDEEQRYFEAAFTVLAQMGRLTVLDMKLQVKQYNPEVHYQDVKYSF